MEHLSTRGVAERAWLWIACSVPIATVTRERKRAEKSGRYSEVLFAYSGYGLRLLEGGSVSGTGPRGDRAQQLVPTPISLLPGFHKRELAIQPGRLLPALACELLLLAGSTWPEQ